MVEIIARGVLALNSVLCKQCLGFGLPIAQGVCYKPEQIRLQQRDNVLQASVQARSYWPDGSLRWVWCEFVVEDDGPVDLALDRDEDYSPRAPLDNNGARKNPDALLTHSSNGVFADLAIAWPDWKLKLQTSVKFSGAARKVYLQNLQVTTVDTGLSSHTIFNGKFRWKAQELKFRCELTFCMPTQQMNIDVCLHNPQAAQHTQGCWDLGDANSVLIDHFDFIFHGEDATFLARVLDQSTQQQVLPGADFTLMQYASGGEHWQSPIHCNADREVPLDFNGFILQEFQQAPHWGLRAQPQLGVACNTSSIALELKDFWQNFPSQLKVTQSYARWRLFAAASELQGGESKTWSFRLAKLGDGQQLSKLLQEKFSGFVRPNSEYFDRCGCLPQFLVSQSSQALDALINEALQEDSGFVAKNERIDMYGWRNYGDLYADHETHGLPAQPYFVSVYNNQYDPLMGMTLQYLHSGDHAWLPLLQTLNRHIQDIDIYDTELDKAEYNGGLFWHTNHYLPAHTSSHRSYSKHHSAVYENFSAGGGPGGQHCYTTGLMLQYRLFGDRRAAEKVEQLCVWIRNFYCGTASLLDRSFRFLTVDIKAEGMSNIGNKAPGFRYPLDRGTGNFIVALLDCYEVSDKLSYVNEAAAVIRQTCHPKENLQQRDLLNVEHAWFYTVFLQALGRFILLKHSLQQYDADYFYGRDCLLHFAAWMLENERFYLDRPEVLEFANDTWCAQDIRKASIYRYASILCSDNARCQQYREACDNTVSYVADKLCTSTEKHYTRIVVLLMQSVFTLGVNCQLPDVAKSPSRHEFGEPPQHKWLCVFSRYILDIFRLLTKLSLSRELRWLKLRLFRRT